MTATSIYCVYRPPFGQVHPRVTRLPVGLTVAELVDRMDLPSVFRKHGEVRVGDKPVPRGAWHLVKPKPEAGGIVNAVTFHAPIMGGGGDGGKNPLAVIAGLALTILSGGAAGGLFGAGGFFQVSTTLFAAGSTSALLLAGGISLIGSLLLNALVPPPTLDAPADSGQAETRRNALARGNVLDPNGVVPRVVGERRVFPPLLCEPLVSFDGDDEVVEAVYGLSGPHRLNEVRVGAAPVEDVIGLEVQTRDGFPGTPRQTLVRRYARTESVNAELRPHQIDDVDGTKLDPEIDLARALPQPRVIATRPRPDEHELQLTWPQGMGRPATPDDLVRTPIRLRIRQRGTTTWRNLPEIHYRGADFRQLRATIRLIWREPETIAPTGGTSKGFVAIYTSVPNQTIAPPTPGWTADPYFYAGSGDTYATSANLGATGVQNYTMSRYTVEFILDPAEWAPGVYEVEMTRGATVRNALWVDSAYTYSSVIYDLFGYFGAPPTIPFSRDDLVDTIALTRSMSVFNSNPVQTDDYALIAVRGRNVNIERLSVLAGGWVRDWNGTGWDEWAITSNPAPHYRDILVGAQNANPLPRENLDDDALLEWRTECNLAGYVCDALVSDTSVDEALTVVAGCGYARPYASDRWGVIRDYNRSAETPVQMFTPRNSANFSWQKAFADLPDGLRITFDDAALDYEPRQLSVFRRNITRDNGRMEQVRYEGVTTEAAAIARAQYDLAQLELRATLFSVNVAQDALVCRRGSLVGLVHDAIARQGGYARVIEDGPDGLRLDAKVACSNEVEGYAVTDIYDVENVWALGTATEAVIRYPDGEIVTVALDNVTGDSDLLEPVTPPAQVVPAGSLVSTRVLTQEFRRMIVFDMRFKPDYQASLTLVDEAPEIFAA